MPDRQFRLLAPPETLDADPPLRKLMTRRLLGISIDADVYLAMRTLSGAGLRHLPAMDGDHCLGLVFEHDVLRAIADVSVGPPSRLVVGDLYQAVAALSPAERRSVAARYMAATGLDAIMVVEEGKLLGIVTATDIIRSIAAVPPERQVDADPSPESSVPSDQVAGKAER